MNRSKYMNPAHMVADSIANLHTNNLTTFPKAGLNKDEKTEVAKECISLFDCICKDVFIATTDGFFSIDFF